MRFTPRPDCQIKNLTDVYEKHLPDIGTFVEVGAFDGATYSNTVFLAEAGWNGLYLEAHPDFADQCRLNHRDKHPRIQIANCGISDREDWKDLYIIGECSTFVWDQTAINWGGNKERKIRVHVNTLNSLLISHDIQPRFELLVIDVEHHEMEVLKPFNLHFWKPKMVIIETHEGSSDPNVNFMAAPISEYFSSFSYKKLQFDQINTIFIRE